MVSHTETIVCPECHRTQTATVEHTRPWYVYVHECECGYTITESEWEEDGDAIPVAPAQTPETDPAT